MDDPLRLTTVRSEWYGGAYPFKVFFFDGLTLAPVLLLVFPFRDVTLYPCLALIVILTYLTYRGLRVPSALRIVRAWLAGRTVSRVRKFGAKRLFLR